MQCSRILCQYLMEYVLNITFDQRINSGLPVVLFTDCWLLLFIGDIVGVSFFPYAYYDLSAENMLHQPYGSGAEMLFNFAVNLYTLKMMRALSNMPADRIDKVTYSLNIGKLSEFLFDIRSWRLTRNHSNIVIPFKYWCVHCCLKILVLLRGFTGSVTLINNFLGIEQLIWRWVGLTEYFLFDSSSGSNILHAEGRIFYGIQMEWEIKHLVSCSRIYVTYFRQGLVHEWSCLILSISTKVK